MGRVVKFKIKMDILDRINQRIKEYESTAEELVQEYGNEERADQYLAKAEALQELKAEILDNVNYKELLGTIEIE